jgi:hypothetical protein
VELRFNWNAGIAQDPFDPATIYYGSQFLHKSTDRGASWTVISPDLTSDNPEWQTYKESGGLTYDVTAAENFTSIVAIAPSPLEAGTIWVGTDDGRVHLTRDGGENWSRIDSRARGVPADSWVPMITASPHDAGTAFVVFDNHRRGDMTPYLYRVSDYGRDWDALVSDPVSGYALSVLQDPVDPELLFLGTEFGLFVSTDGGGEWFRFSAGVPTVSVMDMAIQARENDLVLGTHGRSIYVLDDYSALRGLGAADFGQRLAILSTTPGQQYDAGQTPSTRFTGSGEFRADNEAYGVMLTFMASGDDLPHPDDSRSGDADPDPPKVELTVRDAAGQLIRTQKFPVIRGVNRIVWSMSHDGVRPMPTPDPDPAASLEDGLPDGPEVPPGDYELTLTLAAEGAEPATATTTARVLADPRIDVTPEARAERFQALLEMQTLQERTVTAVERIVSARADVDTVVALLERQKDPGASLPDDLANLREQADAVRDGLDELERRFRTPPGTKGIVYDDDKVANQVNLAMGFAASSSAAPSPTARLYAEQAQRALTAATTELEDFFNDDLAGFRQSVTAAGIGLLRDMGAP